MAVKAKTTSSCIAGISDSSVFSSCRVFNVADLEEGSTLGAGMRYYVKGEKQHQCHHVLDTCYLCKRSIRKNSNIYMYRGELPFCSEQCRDDQAEMDFTLEQLHQAQKKNEKQNLTPVNQIKCPVEKDSCIHSEYRNFGYSIVRDIIALVVG